MIDIDHFKLLNDQYGHLSGDACLQRVAAVMKGALGRRADLIGRYGGEEFMVLLDNIDEAGAISVGENLRQAVMGLCIEHRGSDEQVVTISVGAASAAAGSRITGTQLVAAADQALYAAKRQGRNRVRSLVVGPGDAA